MRRQKAVLLGDLFGEFLKSEGLERGIERIRVFEAWDSAVGGRIADMTTEKYFKDGRLICKLDSSSAKSYLFAQRKTIIEKMNSILESTLIKEIIIK